MSEMLSEGSSIQDELVERWVRTLELDDDPLLYLLSRETFKLRARELMSANRKTANRSDVARAISIIHPVAREVLAFRIEMGEL